MKIFLSIAWRNIMRNKKRSFITIFAISVGLLAVIFLQGFMEGIYPMMIENMTSIYSGDMQVTSKAHLEEPFLKNSIVHGEGILQTLSDNPEVESYSPRLITMGLATYGENSQGVAITGVDPDLEAAVGKMDDYVMEGGSFLQGEHQNGLVIGRKLAKNLEVSMGEEVLLVTSNRFNNLSYLGPLPIVGLIDSKVDDLDRTAVFVDRKILATELFIDESVEYTNPDVEVTKVDGIFTYAAIQLSDSGKLPDTKAAIQQSIDSKYIARDWGDIQPLFKTATEIQDTYIYVVLAIVMIIVVAGILNTVLMSVMERTREFGIMRALGTKRRQIFLTVTFESIILGIMGIIVGIIVGVGLVLIFEQVGLNIYGNMDMSMMSNFYLLETTVYPALSMIGVLKLAAIVLVSVVFISIYPARKAAKMEPVSAIKTLG